MRDDSAGRIETHLDFERLGRTRRERRDRHGRAELVEGPRVARRREVAVRDARRRAVAQALIHPREALAGRFAGIDQPHGDVVFAVRRAAGEVRERLLHRDLGRETHVPMPRRRRRRMERSAPRGSLEVHDLSANEEEVGIRDRERSLTRRRSVARRRERRPRLLLIPEPSTVRHQDAVGDRLREVRTAVCAAEPQFSEDRRHTVAILRRKAASVVARRITSLRTWRAVSIGSVAPFTLIVMPDGTIVPDVDARKISAPRSPT